MDNVRLTFLFYRYVNKTCSETERRELLNLLSQPENETQVKILMEELWNDLPHRQLSSDASERLLERVLLKEESDTSSPRFFLLRRIAASVLITLLSIGGIYYFVTLDARSDYVVQKSTPDQALPAFVKLSDGSTVVLNAGSKLDYPESFAGNVREVSLEGEGYFDITPDALRPFVVHTGRIKTTVLGTAFNIRAYPKQENVTVTVKRGKVQVSDEQNVIGIINPNQQITFNTHYRNAEQTTVNTDEATQWMERDIFFDDITLGHAIDQLEKRFELSIDVENERLANCRFTGTFVKGEDLKQILTILCEFNNATLKEKPSGGFVIEGGECPS